MREQLRLFIEGIFLPPEYEYVNFSLPITDHNYRRSQTFMSVCCLGEQTLRLKCQMLESIPLFPIIVVSVDRGSWKSAEFRNCVKWKKFPVQQTYGLTSLDFSGSGSQGRRSHYSRLPSFTWRSSSRRTQRHSQARQHYLASLASLQNLDTAQIRPELSGMSEFPTSSPRQLITIGGEQNGHGSHSLPNVFSTQRMNIPRCRSCLWNPCFRISPQ